jgi:hypothetical protein
VLVDDGDGRVPGRCIVINVVMTMVSPRVHFYYIRALRPTLRREYESLHVRGCELAARGSLSRVARHDRAFRQICDLLQSVETVLNALSIAIEGSP